MVSTEVSQLAFSSWTIHSCPSLAHGTQCPEEPGSDDWLLLRCAAWLLLRCALSLLALPWSCSLTWGHNRDCLWGDLSCFYFKTKLWDNCCPKTQVHEFQVLSRIGRIMLLCVPDFWMMLSDHIRYRYCKTLVRKAHCVVTAGSSSSLSSSFMYFYFHN